MDSNADTYTLNIGKRIGKYWEEEKDRKRRERKRKIEEEEERDKEG